MGALLALSCCAPLPAPPTGQVELIEDGAALLVDAQGHRRTVAAAALPPGTREGDFVVEGALDPALRAQALDELARALRGLRVPVPPGLSLEPSGPAPLTPGPEQ